MSNKFPDDNFEEEENDEEMFYTEDEYNDLLDENIELKKESYLLSLQELNERLIKDAISICSNNCSD